MKRALSVLRESFLENGTYKVVALFITLSLWVVIMEKKEQTLIKDVDIQFLIPSDLVALRKPSSRVQFKVRGPRMAVKKFADSSESINVDLSGADAGRTVVRIYEDLLQLPAGVRVLGVSPSRVSLDLDRLQTRKVPIRPEFTLGLERDVKIQLDPAEAEILGAESTLRQIVELRTESLDEKLKDFLERGSPASAKVIVNIPDVAGLSEVKTKTVEVTFQKGHK